MKKNKFKFSWRGSRWHVKKFWRATYSHIKNVAWGSQITAGPQYFFVSPHQFLPLSVPRVPLSPSIPLLPQLFPQIFSLSSSSHWSQLIILGKNIAPSSHVLRAAVPFSCIYNIEILLFTGQPPISIAGRLSSVNVQLRPSPASFDDPFST